MAEEGTLGLARASHVRDDDEEPSKEELQRRMEEARESITQTVTEIKETVTNQYYSVKETVSDALDWRHHFRQRPITFSVGALSVGFLVGYGLAGALKGDGESVGYPTSEETDVFTRTGATPARYEEEEENRYPALPKQSYAAQAATGDLSESAGYERDSASAEEQRPGLFERFKETSAYDRLQTEVASLGDRFIEQLSSTAQNVVLPALFNKIKELFGVDLSQQQGAEQPRSLGGRAAQSGAQATNAQAAGAAAAGGASGSSYATSENRGYGAQSSEGASGRGSNDSVLDLDR